MATDLDRSQARQKKKLLFEQNKNTKQEQVLGGIRRQNIYYRGRHRQTIIQIQSDYTIDMETEIDIEIDIDIDIDTDRL